MREATQKELEERKLNEIRDKQVELKYPPQLVKTSNAYDNDWYQPRTAERVAYHAGFDSGALEMAKIKDAQIEKLVEALEQYEDIAIYKVDGIDITGPEPEEIENEYYVAKDALENFRKEVK